MIQQEKEFEFKEKKAKAEKAEAEKAEAEKAEAEKAEAEKAEAEKDKEKDEPCSDEVSSSNDEAAAPQGLGAEKRKVINVVQTIPIFIALQHNNNNNIHFLRSRSTRYPDRYATFSF
jgi:hypothetical protein